MGCRLFFVQALHLAEKDLNKKIDILYNKVLAQK